MTMETTQIFILVVEGLLTIVIAMGGFIVKGMSDRIKSLETKLGLVETDMSGMKLNYLDRFKEVIQNQTDAKEELTKSQTIMKEELIIQQTKVKEELVSQQTKVKEELMQHYRDTKEELIKAINALSLAIVSNQPKTRK